MADVYTAFSNLFKLAFSAIPGTWFFFVMPFVIVVAFLKFIQKI